MSANNPLAAIPTDQLVLRLLQELAARVEKLGQHNEVLVEQNPAVDQSQIASSPDTPTITTRQSNTTRSAFGEGVEEKGDSRCLVCREVFGVSCHCVDVPYGYLLNEETPPEGLRLMSMNDRATLLHLSDPDAFSQLERLGIAGVPPDGRYPFQDFWSSIHSQRLKAAVEVVDQIKSIGAMISISDFDSHGAIVTYGPGLPMMGDKKYIDGSLEMPTSKVSPRFKWSASWNRLM